MKVGSPDARGLTSPGSAASPSVTPGHSGPGAQVPQESDITAARALVWAWCRSYDTSNSSDPRVPVLAASCLCLAGGVTEGDKALRKCIKVVQQRLHDDAVSSRDQDLSGLCLHRGVVLADLHHLWLARVELFVSQRVGFGRISTLAYQALQAVWKGLLLCYRSSLLALGTFPPSLPLPFDAGTLTPIAIRSIRAVVQTLGGVVSCMCGFCRCRA